MLMDALMNNFPGFRRFPLFIDFDAYARKALPVSPLYTLSGVLIKTHYPETPLPEPYAKALSEIAARSIVLNPIRKADEVRNSLSKWGVHFSLSEYAEIERSFFGFWAAFSPVVVEFSQLLNPEGISSVLSRVSVVSGLTPLRVSNPVVPASTRFGIYIDKLITRVAGGYAPRINTTIGFQLRQKRICDSEHLRSWRDS